MTISILVGDCRDVLRTLADGSVNCIVTSPPYYGLRDYGHDGQIGLEETPDEYVAQMVAVFREARRVLSDDGTLWLNIGDSYAGSWGAQGRQGETGQMASRSVSKVREKSKISAAQIAAHPHKASRTGSIKQEGLKPKDLIGIPWMLAFALRADGWYLRQDIIWHKPNPMPESVRDRCTKAHEYVFLLSKSPRYFFDAEAISEEASRPEGAGNVTHKAQTAYEAGDERLRTKAGLTEIGPRDRRNKRDVWSIPTQPFSEAHFATMAPELARLCIMAGCPLGGTVLDPFGGAGTTGLVADQLQRNAIMVELNPEYVEIARKRISADAGMFATEAA